jgi:ferredoxin
MKTAIYYYTGTGNSLWTARLMAGEIGDAALYNMSQMKNIPTIAGADAVGLVFPVHMWGIPSLVIRFIEKLDKNPDTYYFAVAVNAGQVSRTLIQLKGLMRSYGLTLSAGFDLVLPSNYIPWGGPGPAERLEELYQAAREKIEYSAGLVKRMEAGHIEKGPLWQRIIFTALYKITYNMIPKMDKDFWVDEKCNGCAICLKVCPVENITVQADKPVWLHHCEQCLACIQWCPQEAIQFGKKTPTYERYHHPEVKVKDMIAPHVR